MITFVNIFYDFGLLLNTDHAFSVFRYLTTIKHFSPYFKNKHVNCARQNQISERIIKPNRNPRGTVMYTIWRRVVDKWH